VKFLVFLLIVISVCLIGIWRRCSLIFDILDEWWQKHGREGLLTDVNIAKIGVTTTGRGLPVEVKNWPDSHFYG